MVWEIRGGGLKHPTSFIVLLSLLVFGCSDPGGYVAPVTQVGPPSEKVDKGPKFKVIFFAAGWCEPCKKELPKVTPLMKEILGKKQSRVEPIILLTQGWTNGSPPTPKFVEEFTQYMAEHSVTLPMEADPFPSKTYRRIFGGFGSLPSTAFLNLALEDLPENWEKFQGESDVEKIILELQEKLLETADE